MSDPPSKLIHIFISLTANIRTLHAYHTNSCPLSIWTNLTVYHSVSLEKIEQQELATRTNLFNFHLWGRCRSSKCSFLELLFAENNSPRLFFLPSGDICQKLNKKKNVFFSNTFFWCHFFLHPLSWNIHSLCLLHPKYASNVHYKVL